MCIHERIFSPLRLFCDPNMLWHVAIDIEVDADKDDTKTLKPFKVIVYWNQSPDTKTEPEADLKGTKEPVQNTQQNAVPETDSEVEQLTEQVADLKVDTPQPASIWNEAKITELYAEHFADERHGYTGVEFRPLADAPQSRKLHPAAVCTMLLWQSMERADNVRNNTPKQYAELRKEVLKMNRLSAEVVSDDIEFLVHKEVGICKMAQHYGETVKLDNRWQLFRHTTLMNVLQCMQAVSESGNEDEKEEAIAEHQE